MEKLTIEKLMKDSLGAMDSSYNELKIILEPVFHDKIKKVNGKLLKDCFKHIKNILIAVHQFKDYESQKLDSININKVNLGGKDGT